MTILEHITEQLPNGWTLRNLISLDPDWQVNIADDEHVCVGTGETIEAALAAAKVKVFDCVYAGRFNFLEHAAREIGKVDLLAKLGLRKLKPPLTRRRL